MEQLGRTGRVQSAAAASQPGSWFRSRLDRAVVHYNTQRRDLFPLQLRTDSSVCGSCGFVPVCSALLGDLSAGSSQVFRSVPFFIFSTVKQLQPPNFRQSAAARERTGPDTEPRHYICPLESAGKRKEEKPKLRCHRQPGASTTGASTTGASTTGASTTGASGGRGRLRLNKTGRI